MTEIRIGSLNVRGLAGVQKRKDVFKWLRDKKLCIYCLQDVHCTEETVNRWELEWGYKCYIAPYRNDSRGTAILINNNFEHKVHKLKTDPGGNYVVIDIEMLGKRITLVNCYGPNTDNPQFYGELNSILEDFQNLSIILCGDWNLVQNQDLDTYGYLHENNTAARERVLNMKDEWDLIDPWRENNPDQTRYTWRTIGPPLKQARLDFFLISPDLFAIFSASDINAGYRTDHSLITVSFLLEESRRGRGFWKLNTSLLNDPEYLTQIRSHIKEVICQYAQDGQNVHNKNVLLTIDDQLFFETLKMEIRGYTISFSGRKKKERVQKEKTLEGEINKMEKQLSQNPSTELADIIQSQKEELKRLREPSIQGMMIRSRARWVEKGEKPTRYFCNLEKRQYTSKVISWVDTGDRIVTEQGDILKEQAAFYNKLYSSTDPQVDSKEIEFFTREKIIKKLSVDQKVSCEGSITEEEVKSSIKMMANNKTPGSDGFPVEFYKMFWPEIGHFLIRSLNRAFETGTLSITQRQGVITCLPKGAKPRQFLKNWRPISLLNVDYKILSSCLASRMKAVLPEVISNDQKGFLQGRFIGENTRLVLDIIQYLERHDRSGILLLVDFEKAFDSIEWSYVKHILHTYNFGSDFIKWFNILYTGSQSCVTNNGHSSRFFDLGRGCRQGDPLSPYIFLLAIEPLAMAIKEENSINGITIEGTIHTIGQYADDTFLTLEKDEGSLRKAIEIFRLFQICSGLKINIDKTQAVIMGKTEEQNQEFCPDLKLNWTNQFTLLGIQIDITNLGKIVSLNLDSKQKEIEQLFRSYKRRNLSIIGKITVVKTLALPKLVHALSTLPDPDQETMKKLNETITRFVWNCRTGKIGRNLIAQDKEMGGLKLTHLPSFAKALKIRWMKLFFTNQTDGGCVSILRASIGQPVASAIGSLDSRSLKVIASQVSNNFWADVIRAWADLIDNDEIEPDEIVKHRLWQAWFIRNPNLARLSSLLTEKGCVYIADLLDQTCNFLSLEDFMAKFDIRMNWFDYVSLVSSVPRSWRLKLEHMEENPGAQDDLKTVQALKKTKKVCNYAYQIFVKKLNYKDKYKQHWQNLLGEITENEWVKYNVNAFRCTQSAKLQSFQFKVIHKILYTNSLLMRVGIVNDDRCVFCKTEKETIMHLFINCPVIFTLWSRLIEWLKPFIDLSPYACNRCLLFGTLDNDTANWILLQTRFFIYSSSKKEDMTVNGIFSALKRYIALEFKVVKNTTSPAKYSDVWLPLIAAFGDE